MNKGLKQRLFFSTETLFTERSASTGVQFTSSGFGTNTKLSVCEAECVYVCVLSIECVHTELALGCIYGIDGKR